MATEPLAHRPLARQYLLTGPQVCWLALQAAALVGLAAWLFAAKAEYIQVLWSDALGARMGVFAVVLVAVNFAALAGGFVALNLARTQALLHKVLLALLCVGCFLLCYLPVIFILLVGPAAVNIQNAMLRP